MIAYAYISIYTGPVQKVSSHAIWKTETFIEEDTRYKKHCAQDNDASVPFKAGTLASHTVFLIAICCPVIFSWISFMVWNLFPFKSDFSFKKSQKSQSSRSRLYGGWVTRVIWCFAKKLCMRCYAWDGVLSWWSSNHQLPITGAFWIIKIVCAEECLRLTQNLMQICCSTCSVLLNVMATQYTCSLNDIYCPHWLVQWSRHCSRMCIPVHSAWLPGYIDVTQIVLIVLTMAGLFLDRLHHICLNDT